MEKIKYILGNKEHAKEIQQYFEEFAKSGRDNYNFELSNFAYFIHPDTGSVSYFKTGGWTFRALNESGVFEELKYPYMKPKLKVIRGDWDRCSEVIQTLKDLGGDNSVFECEGCDPSAYYYLNDNAIDCLPAGDKFFNNYELEVLSLPEKSDESAVFTYTDKQSMILEPFVTKILVRNNSRDRWVAGIYVNTINYDSVPCVNIAGSAIDYLEWIHYEGNEHLAFTNKDPE